MVVKEKFYFGTFTHFIVCLETITSLNQMMRTVYPKVPLFGLAARNFRAKCRLSFLMSWYISLPPSLIWLLIFLFRVSIFCICTIQYGSL